MSIQPRHRATGILFVAGLALTACGGSGDSSPSTAPSTTPVTTPATEPAVTDAPPEPESAARCASKQDDDTYLPTPCDEAHDAEFVGSVAPPAGEVPIDESERTIMLVGVCGDAVEAFAQRPIDRYGIDVGFVSLDEPGTAFASDVECWAEVTAEGALSASLESGGVESALGANVVIADLEPGQCYLFVDPDEDSYDIGAPVDCFIERAEVFIGVVESTAMVYDADVVIDEGYALCEEQLAATDLVLDPAELSVIYPLEENWTALGRRSILCVASAAAIGAEITPRCATGADTGDFEEVDCSVPHDAELVGAIPPPEGSLTADPTQAQIDLTRHCSEAVTDYVGRSTSLPGIMVGFETDVGLGDEFDGDVVCYATSTAVGSLVGSIAEVGLDAALGDTVILADLAPGTCFVFAPDSFSLGMLAGCDEVEAFVAIGTFEFADEAYPGKDALAAERNERCAELLASSDVAADPATVSGTYPSEINWIALDQRIATCDARPV